MRGSVPMPDQRQGLLTVCFPSTSSSSLSSSSSGTTPAEVRQGKRGDRVTGGYQGVGQTGELQ